jgi:hypothetical protein
VTGVFESVSNDFPALRETLRERAFSGHFAEGNEFGFGDGHALSLQQEVAQVLVAAATAKQGFDVAIDSFHDSEPHLDTAVVENAFQMPQ